MGVCASGSVSDRLSSLEGTLIVIFCTAALFRRKVKPRYAGEATIRWYGGSWVFQRYRPKSELYVTGGQAAMT